MNRLKEYQDLLQELNIPLPELAYTLDRAYQRKKRRNHIVRTMAGIAASFFLFVALVNFCSPVAYACSKVPFLRELAEAVTFSPSLSEAVDNKYVQPINLTQVDGDVTASVEYLIVDQKQINVFFRLDSDVYPEITADPVVLSADGSGPEPCSCGYGEWNIPNGELQRITIDYVKESVPESLRLKLNVRNMSMTDSEATVESVSFNDYLFEDIQSQEFDYIAHFDFLLEFDPEFTETGKVIDINQTVILEGQEITFTNMEIYPTHLRINVEASEQNTAWLKMLYFYIGADWGVKFDAISDGITATGDSDSPAMVSFRANSSYFYDAKRIKIVITGAEWLNKDMEKIYVNLKTGETGPLPEGVGFHSAIKESSGWLLAFEAGKRDEGLVHQLFSSKYYDVENNMYEIHSWSSTGGERNEDGEVTSFISYMPLKGYFEDEVWLSPQYSHVWTADKPITIQAQ